MFEQWGQDLDLEALLRSQSAIDLEAETSLCPACGASFPPAELRCSGCGLRFG